MHVSILGNTIKSIVIYRAIATYVPSGCVISINIVRRHRIVYVIGKCHLIATLTHKIFRAQKYFPPFLHDAHSIRNVVLTFVDRICCFSVSGFMVTDDVYIDVMFFHGLRVLALPATCTRACRWIGRLFFVALVLVKATIGL